jgi:hypothetical protein
MFEKRKGNRGGEKGNKKIGEVLHDRIEHLKDLSQSLLHCIAILCTLLHYSMK